MQRQQQLDSDAAQLQQQDAELTRQLRDFQAQVAHTEAALQEREAALGDLQVTPWRQQQQQYTTEGSWAGLGRNAACSWNCGAAVHAWLYR
jgi:septal ring factor EnvC (AmiA/AmiB activator)